MLHARQMGLGPKWAGQGREGGRGRKVICCSVNRRFCLARRLTWVASGPDGHVWGRGHWLDCLWVYVFICCLFACLIMSE